MDEKDKELNELRRELKFWKGVWHSAEDKPKEDDQYFVLWEATNRGHYTGPYYAMTSYDTFVHAWRATKGMAQHMEEGCEIHILCWKELPLPIDILDRVMEEL